MKLNSNEIKKIITNAKTIEDCDYSNYEYGRSSNGGCYGYGTTYSRTRKGWLMRNWTTCDMVDPESPMFINDIDLAKRLSHNEWDQEDYVLIVNDETWSKSHPINKLHGSKFRRANLDNAFTGWNHRLGGDVWDIILGIEVGGSVSMQRVEYGWIHEYTRTRNGWHYHRHGQGELNEPDRNDVSEAEVFHWLYDAMEDYPDNYLNIWVESYKGAKPRDIKPSRFLDHYFKTV